jgi:hypothetical protein
MKIVRLGLAQLLLVSVLGLASASTAVALELPDVHVLSGESYPATAEGKIEGSEVAVLETELGEKLKANAMTIQTVLTELSSLDVDALTFLGVLDQKKGFCNTVGDGVGTVKFNGEYHLVLVSDAPATAGFLLLFKELVVECEKVKVKVRGPLLIKPLGLQSGTDITNYKIVTNCSGKGKQELKTYLNDAGETTKGILTANFGLGFEAACLNVSKELSMSSSKMLDFLL